MQFPGERGSEQKARAVNVDDRGYEIKRRYEPSQVYGGLLFHARMRGWKDGWAAYAFKEIYGNWPRDADKGEPFDLRGSDLEEWCWTRKRK